MKNWISNHLNDSGVKFRLLFCSISSHLKVPKRLSFHSTLDSKSTRAAKVRKIEVVMYLKKLCVSVCQCSDWLKRWSLLIIYRQEAESSRSVAMFCEWLQRLKLVLPKRF